MKRCLFCKSIKKLSREHIIPEWLLKELELTEEDVFMEHYSIFGIPKSQRTHSFKSLVNAMVCEKCNNGWMSDLEASVKDLIIKWINLNIEKKDILSLAKDHELIARWALKTAILLNYPTNYRNIIPESHFHKLYKSKIPSGVYINLAICNKPEPIKWRQSQQLLIFGNFSKYASRLKEVYKITMQFNHLLLRISYVPFENLTQGYTGETSVALWPEFGKYKELKVYKNIDEFDVGNYFIEFKP